jgi:NAD(P)-dependent dehydrogenase (short-subunit alcohol dehydrogenase family)
MIDVNIKGVLYGIAAALPYMKQQKAGHIINVSSVAGRRPRRHGLLREQTCGARIVGRTAHGGEALQYPHDYNPAGSGSH